MSTEEVIDRSQPARYKVGQMYVLVEMFPEYDQLGKIIVPGKRQVLKAVKGIIRAVGKKVDEYWAGEVVIVAPGNGGLIKDEGRIYRSMPQELIIAVDNKLTSYHQEHGWDATVAHDVGEVSRKFLRHDGEKLNSEKV